MLNCPVFGQFKKWLQPNGHRGFDFECNVFNAYVTFKIPCDNYVQGQNLGFFVNFGLFATCHRRLVRLIAFLAVIAPCLPGDVNLLVSNQDGFATIHTFRLTESQVLRFRLSELVPNSLDDHARRVIWMLFADLC